MGRKFLDPPQQFKYELISPEGGWGYVVTLGLSIMFTTTVYLMSGFGIVFGKFLASVGDETNGTTIVNGLFNTVLCFTGLAANQLLQKMSYRKVGLIGAFLYCIGSFSTIFVTNLMQLIITFGFLQGLGFGLMMPSVFTAFNHYFDKRKNFVMSVAQAGAVSVTILIPAALKFLMNHYGFRATLALIFAISLHTIPAMLALQPIKWHAIKRRMPIVTLKIDKLVKDQPMRKIQNLQAKSKEDLISSGHEHKPLMKRFTQSHHDLRVAHMKLEKSMQSLVSMGSIAMSVTNLNDDEMQKNQPKLTVWQSLANALDLKLFKDPVYVNISLGISLAITSDLVFLSVLPKLLVDMGFDDNEVTILLSIYFTADLICRILLSIFTALVDVKNRHLFLIGVLFSAILRIAFVTYTSFIWTAIIAGGLGFMRCLIQTPLPLVIAEKYTTRFVTAFSLYMVICGVVALTFGPLSAIVKDLTGNDIGVVHLLTVAFLCCAIPWIIELIITRNNERNNNEEVEQV